MELKYFIFSEDSGNYKKGDIITGIENLAKGYIIPVTEDLIKACKLERIDNIPVEVRCEECSEE